MKKRKANIKQHYIPQCYLRNCTDDNGFLNVYNYKDYKKFKVRPNKVSWGRYFHDVNVEVFNRILNLDEAYSEIVDDRIRVLHEDLFAKSIHRLVENLDKVDHGITFKKEDRINIINFIMIQYIRTPEYRSNIDYLVLNFIRFYYSDLEGVDVEDDEYLPTIHNLIIYGLLYYLNGEYNLVSSNYDMFFGHLFDEYSVMMKQLDYGTVRFFVNRTDKPFITTSYNVPACQDINSQNIVIFPFEVYAALTLDP